MLKKIGFFIILSVLGSGLAFGQVEFTNKFFKGRKEELNKARKLLSEAEKYEKWAYSIDSSWLKDAQYLYLQAFDINPDNAALNFTIGRIYVERGFPALAIVFLEKVKEFSSNYHPLLDFYLAEGYFDMGKVQKAEIFYLEFRKNYHEPGKIDYIQLSIDRLAQCKTYQKMKKTPVRAIFTPVDTFRSPGFYPLNLAVDMKSETLFYHYIMDTILVDEKQNKGARRDSIILQKMNESDFSVSNDLDFEALQWQKVAVSPDGESYILKDAAHKYYEYFSIDSSVVQLPEAIFNQYTGWVSYHYNGKYKILSSNIPGGYGGYDLYLYNSYELMNLGPQINSSKDELYAHFHPDGKSVYFSSNGHHSIGGFDIFLTYKNETGYEQPVNLGYPINSTGDEIQFILHPSGRTAWIRGKRWNEGGYHFIWKQEILGAEKEPVALLIQQPYTLNSIREILPVIHPEPCMDCSPTAWLDLNFMNDSLPVEKGRLSIMDLSTGEIIIEKSFLVPGHNINVFPEGKSLVLFIDLPGKLFFSEYINLEKEESFSRIAMAPRIPLVQKGAYMRLSNVSFIGTTDKIANPSIWELEKFKQWLLDNPGVVIAVRGFSASNTSLANARAYAVKNWLTSQGIDASRIRKNGSKNIPGTEVWTNRGHITLFNDYIFVEIMEFAP